jgi:hypothetical protein
MGFVRFSAPTYFVTNYDLIASISTLLRKTATGTILYRLGWRITRYARCITLTSIATGTTTRSRFRLLVSAVMLILQQLIKINGTSGDIQWTLGGKHSSWTIGEGAEFSWQHDPRWLIEGELLSLFDNASTSKRITEIAEMVTLAL